MTGRRGAGEGSIYQESRKLKDGSVSESWVGTIELGRDPLTGRRQRRKVKAPTKAKLLAKMKSARDDADAAVGSGSMLLGAFLDSWMSNVVEHRVDSPNTVAAYRKVVELQIKPALGHVPLAKLTPEQVDVWLTGKAETYSRSYVTRMRSVLADALTHAERRDHVSRNVARLSQLPRTRPPEARQSLTAEQARNLIAASSDDRLGPMVVLGLMTGLRPGELTGLLWSDIDLKRATLTVSGSMKCLPDGTLVRSEPKRATSSKRSIALTVDAVDRLRAHRAAQAEERLAAGDLWTDNGLVFCTGTGAPLHPSNVRRLFALIAEKAGIDGGFPYLMRHTAASLLIDVGVPIEQVADLLGDDPRTLYRHYRHRVRPVVDAAAVPMQLLLGGATG
jgi:integrase